MEIRQEIKRRAADIEARIAPFLPQEKGFQQTVLDAMGVGRLVQNTGAYSFGTDVLVILGKDWKPSS